MIICLNTIIFFRANASLNLESQIKKVDGLVSGLEEKLSEDGPIPDVPNAIKSHSQDIQVRKSSLHILSKSYLYHTGDLTPFKLHVSFAVFRPSEGLWQQLRMT